MTGSSLTAGRAVPRDTDEGWPAQPQDACTTAPKPETHAPPAAPLAPATEAWPTGREEWRAMTRNVVSFCFFKILAAATRLVQDAPERRRHHTPKSITRELHCDYTSMGKFGNAPPRLSPKRERAQGYAGAFVGVATHRQIQASQQFLCAEPAERSLDTPSPRPQACSFSRFSRHSR